MKNNISKEQIEKLVGHAISDARFKEALECAARKQACAYENEKNPVVLQDWYLAKLTEECVQSSLWSYIRNCAIWKRAPDKSVKMLIMNELCIRPTRKKVQCHIKVIG